MSASDRHPDTDRTSTRRLAEQLSWHWDQQARPRLAGLTDQEYHWSPTGDGWDIRPRGEGVALEIGQGDWIIDFALPTPEPPPVTTIAWRLAHVIVGVFGARNALYFGRDPISYETYTYAGHATPALAALDAEYATWLAGVTALSEEELRQPCRDQGFEQLAVADLVLHIHREVIHHLAEVALLRDLYLRQGRTG